MLVSVVYADHCPISAEFAFFFSFATLVLRLSLARIREDVGRLIVLRFWHIPHPSKC